MTIKPWLIALSSIAIVAASQAPVRSQAADRHSLALQQYCAGCHNSRSKIGRDTGMILDSADLSNIPACRHAGTAMNRRLSMR